jgi:hypothetical protein
MNDPVQNPYIDTDAKDSGRVGNEKLLETVRVGMIITAALIQGVVFLVAIGLYLGYTNSDDPEEAPSSAQDTGLPNEGLPDTTAQNMPAGNMPTEAGEWVLPAIGIAACIGACVASWFVVTMMKRVAIRKFRAESTDEILREDFQSASTFPHQVAQLLGASQAWTIVGQAILEGAAMMNGMLMIVDGNLIHLAAIAILIVGIAIQFPTVSKKLALIQQAQQIR